MGVSKGTGLMSSSSDAIYTHKKFKKAVTEIWEKNLEKRNSHPDIIYNSNITSSNDVSTHKRTDFVNEEIQPTNAAVNSKGLQNGFLLNSGYNFICAQCNYSCKYIEDFNNHDCTKLEKSSSLIFCQMCCHFYKSLSDFSHHHCSRSNILGSDVNVSDSNEFRLKKSLQKYVSKKCDKDASSELDDEASTNLPSKYIYKPKFRAHYPPVYNSNQELNNFATGISQISTSTQSATTVSHTFKSSVTNIGLTSSSSNTLSNLCPLNDYGGGKEDDSTLKSASSQYPSMWKGIKSPSPELVGKHINNLIVQNQAIIETHNPLWSLKYRRQSSSSSSSHSEGELSSCTKVRKSSDTSKTSISNSQISMEKLNDCKNDFSTPKVSPTRTEFIPKTHHFKVKSSNSISSCLISVYTSENQHNMSAFSESSLVNSEENVSLSSQSKNHKDFKNLCNFCGAYLANLNSNYCFHCNNRKNTFIMNSQDQELALNLHKNSDDHSNSYNSLNSKLPLVLHNKTTSKVYNSKEIPCSSEYDILGKLNSSLSICNDKRILEKDNLFRNKVLDEYCSLKPNIHHLYGGEVKILDGKETKTLKIDSRKRESPSLDLCIASKHLRVDLDNQESESKIPKSVVVTIAKCGLNSGGTMVKLDNQNTKGEGIIPGIKELAENSVIAFKNCKNLSVDENRILEDFSTSRFNNNADSSTLVSNSVPISISNLSSGLNIPTKTLTFISPPFTHNQNSLINIEPTKNELVASNVFKNNCQDVSRSLSGIIYSSSFKVGDEFVPHVPGMPGPFSQSNCIFKIPFITTSSVLNNEKYSTNTLDYSKREDFSVTDTTACMRSKSSLTESSNKPNQAVFKKIDYMAKNKVIKLPDIVVESPPVPVNTNTEEGEVNSQIESEENECDKFLLPVKRPSTLMIKPQLTLDLHRARLIGSTLVSPDTPRPDKSCAQLFLNGSAYTYLNLKVSTKTFFCCIYRPQPMYVHQSTNPKLSMYSNWQICKTEQPLNIPPTQALGLHISGLYYNSSYTIAKSKESSYFLTNSSYWTQRDDQINVSSNLKSRVPVNNKNTGTVTVSESVNSATEVSSGTTLSSVQSVEKENLRSSSSKRIEIFEGGFKTYEDYTYVRGRGRGRYVCGRCEIRCKKPSMLRKHIRTHSDDRPYGCKHCSFRFKTKGNLTKHLKSKAHYKKCSETGVDPIPMIVDDNHVGQEYFSLQELHSENESYSNQNSDEEEEEEEDDDIDEEDETADEIEEGGSSVSNSSDSMNNKIDEENQIAQLSLTIANSNVTGTVNPSSSSIISSILTPLPANVSNSSIVIDKDELNEEISPMDLTVKRHSIAMDNEEDKSSLLTVVNRSEDILSPVTHSSLLLKSIYETTNKVSISAINQASKINQNSLSNNTNEGQMFQTYLKERAVLDSAKKRYQYLPCTFEPQITLKRDEQPTSDVVSMEQIESVTVSSMQNSSACFSNEPTVMKPLKKTIAHEYILKKSNDISLVQGKKISTESLQNSVSGTSPGVSPRVVEIAGETNLNSTTEFSVGSSINSSDDRPPLDVVTSIERNTLNVPSSTTSSNNSLTNQPNSTPAVISVDGKLLPSYRRVDKNSTSSIPNLDCVNALPSPPANLTVVNNSNGNEKPIFIAPGGVIPSTSNNRLLLGDGKCKCNICHKVFPKQGQLRLHFNIHYIERPHRCDSCGISFRTNGHLQKHKRSVSHFNKVNMNMTFGAPSTDNPRPFKCHDCKVAFRIYGHLAKHLRSKLHIMKLECLGKLPFGTYAEIERSGVNLNEINTSDCENSLDSLQAMASTLFEKQPAKLVSWRQQQNNSQTTGTDIDGDSGNRIRVRTFSSSSTNSEDYPFQDDDSSSVIVSSHYSSSSGHMNEEDTADEDHPDPQVAADQRQISSPEPSLPVETSNNTANGR